MKILIRLPIILIMVLLLQPLLVLGIQIANQGIRWQQGKYELVLKAPQFMQPVLNVVYSKMLSLQAPPLVNPGQKKETSLPLWSLESLLKGKWQGPFESWLNENLPFRANIVRIFNQIYYDYFFKSYINNGALVIDDSRQLNSMNYIEKYCNLKRVKFDISEFERWINELQELSDFFKYRNQHFVYLITPSKAAYFPEYIPTQFSCKSEAARPDYRLLADLLRGADIPYIDGSKIILEAKGKYSAEIFPRGGIHWNMLGAALVTRALFQEINKKMEYPLPDLKFSYIVDNNPKGSDTDLLTMANLWNPDRNYAVAHIKIENENQISILRPKIALVGGSFLHQIREIMMDTQFFNQIDYFNYFKVFHTRYPQNIQLVVDENNPKTYQELLEADIVIIEENEQSLRSNHVKLLRKKLLYPDKVEKDSLTDTLFRD